MSEPSDGAPGRVTGLALAGWGAIGLAAAFVLTVERFRLLENPDHRLSCDLSPILSCGSVMVTEQARVFGFPNPLLGIGGFAVVVTLGVLLAGGVRLPAWVHTGFAVGAGLGLVFVAWLSFQSIHRIGALCPWCLVVWTVTIPTAVWAIALATRGTRLGRAMWDFRYLVVVVLYLVVVVQALVVFWDYWRTLA